MNKDESCASDSVDREIQCRGEILDILQVGEVFHYAIRYSPSRARYVEDMIRAKTFRAAFVSFSSLPGLELCL